MRAIDLVLAKKEKIEKREKEKAWKEFFKLAGAWNSGLKDVAEKHDEYFADDEIRSWKRK